VNKTLLMLSAGWAVLLAAPAAGAGETPDESTPPSVESVPSCLPPVQWALTIANGGGIIGNDGWSFREGAYHLGGHATVFIRRKGPKAWAGGLTMLVGMLDVKYFLAGAGVSVLVPVSTFLPIVVDAFPVYLRGKKKDRMGVGGRLWWGLHSFNYSNTEVATIGLYMMFQRTVLGEGRDLWLAVWGIDLSLHILAIPFGMAGQAMVRKKKH
jgi:hypothetical protein